MKNSALIGHNLSIPDATFVEELNELVEARPRDIHEMLEDNLVGIFFVSDSGSSGFTTWMGKAGASFRGFILIDEQAIVQTANARVAGRAAPAFRIEPGDSLAITMEVPENNIRRRGGGVHSSTQNRASTGFCLWGT